mgnify:FL=1
MVYGYKFYGKWELNYDIWLDENLIEWQRPNEVFQYTMNDKVHHYTPDFYLPKTNEYIEIKGYETEKDRCKWRDFPLKLRILKRDDLKLLNIKC